MTRSAVVYTKLSNAHAGADLANQIKSQLDGDTPHAVIVFASPRNDYGALLRALDEGCRPGALVGCSSAGEFTDQVAGEGLTCAVALHAPEMAFNAAIGQGISRDTKQAARQLSAKFGGAQTP